MARALLSFMLALGLAALPGVVPAQTPAPADPEVAKGVKLVEDGDYDGAILTLDNASRRLASDPSRAKDLSQAYLYLGIAYVGKGHEAAARAKFREALTQIRDLTLSPDKFPPKVIDVFEAARAEAGKAPAQTAEKKGGGGHKGLLIGAGIVAVGGGVAIAAASGGSKASDNRQTLNFADSVAENEQRFFSVIPRSAGALEATVTWQDGQIELGVGLEERNPPYTDLGQAQRTTNTTRVLRANVTQQEYVVIVSNYSGRRGTEPFTVRVTLP